MSPIPLGSGSRYRTPSVAGSSNVNVTEVEIDFGSETTTNASLVVTGLTWVTADTKLAAQVLGTTADHPNPEEPIIEQIHVTVGERVAATGFTVFAHAPNGTTGTYHVHVFGV